MRVLIDDNALDLDVESIAEAIAAGAARAEGDGRLVVDVFVDGDRWSEAQLRAEGDLAAEAGEVRLVTADPAALVDETLSDAITALTDADALQQEAAELIQADDTPPALARLDEAVAIWLSVQKAVALSAQVLAVDLGLTVVDGTPAPRIIEDLNERLRAVQVALEAKDPIGLADTLLYEFPDVVERWRRLLAHLREGVGTGEA